MTTMDTLMEFMTATKDLGEIYLTGDFNARTGSENQEPSDRDRDDIPDWGNTTLSHPVTTRVQEEEAKTQSSTREEISFSTSLLVQI